MAISKINGVVLVLVVVAFAQMTIQSEAEVQCSKVQAALQPCLTYLVNGGEPGETCCVALKGLKELPTTSDRQAACACIKAAASKLPSSIDVNAASLPQKCNDPVSFPVSRSVDCSSVN